MSAATSPSANSLAELQKALSDKDALIAALMARVQALEEYIRLERLRKFAARSEKVSNDQFELFNEAELCEVAEEGLAEQEQAAQPPSDPSSAKQTRGRKALPAELPRVRIEYDLPETQKQCTCGCERSLIGEETSEQLDIIPAQVRVLVHVRKKYACRTCEAGVETHRCHRNPSPRATPAPAS